MEFDADDVPLHPLLLENIAQWSSDSHGLLLNAKFVGHLRLPHRRNRSRLVDPEILMGFLSLKQFLISRCYTRYQDRLEGDLQESFAAIS